MDVDTPLIPKEEKDIYVSISKSYEEKVKRKREIIFRIIEIIVVLGQQNIPFRGHNWNKEKKIEDDNFSRFLRWKADDVPILKLHLENAPYNVQYTSPDIQNELINLCGLQIKDTIIKKASEAKWFSIMAAESTDVGKKEQMALCIRCVEKNATVFEGFIGFIEMEKVDSESIAAAIVDTVQECRYLSGDDTGKLVIAGSNDDEPMPSDTLIEKAGKDIRFKNNVKHVGQQE
ncbi:unnamed protein product [Mytilus coruscus]|uniref:DUF4371 domain-containing protein n=1 Tax=Mytilus coruscus TaxID=42192 RepID=A0A6J8DM77_MYTCO|nr:unnamed protein product [Mytilus coruscus]